MDWKEIQEKYEHLRSEGKTEEEAIEILKDEVGVFAKDCAEPPEKVTGMMPDFGSSIFATLLSAIFFGRGGWGR